MTLLVVAGALDDGALDGAVVDSAGAVAAVVGTAVLVGAAVGDVAVVGGRLTGGAADSDPSVAAERPARADPVMARPCGWAASPMVPRETWIVSVAPSATATVRMANHAAPAAATVCLACLAGWLRLGMSPSHQVDAGPHRRTANPSDSSTRADQRGRGNRPLQRGRGLGQRWRVEVGRSASIGEEEGGAKGQDGHDPDTNPLEQGGAVVTSLLGGRKSCTSAHRISNPFLVRAVPRQPSKSLTTSSHNWVVRRSDSTSIRSSLPWKRDEKSPGSRSGLNSPAP